MNPSILSQYRQYRQRPTPQGLFPIAKALGLLCSPEPQTGKIGDIRFGQINLRLDRQLNCPDKKLTTLIYREFSDLEILMELRNFGCNENEIQLFIETIAKKWMENSSIQEALQAGCDAIDTDTYTLYLAQPGGMRALEAGNDLIEDAFKRALQKMELECFGQKKSPQKPMNSTLPHYADPEEFERIYGELQSQSPGNPYNRDAAIELAKPPERRGWAAIYINWQRGWKEAITDA